MTNTDHQIVESDQPAQDKRRPSANRSALALWLGIAAVLAPSLYFAFFPLVGLGAVAGVVAVVLVLVGRKRGQRGAASDWALALGALGALVDTVVFIVILSLVIGRGLDDVELRAEGGADFTVTFSDDLESHVEVWDTSWFGKFNTAGSSAQITVTPSAEGAGQTHSCTILWNDVVVSQESSGAGPVTCRYER